jgi:hypothetical protein
MRSVEDVQYLAGHSDLRTTRLYDGRPKQGTRNTVERISVWGANPILLRDWVSVSACAV